MGIANYTKRMDELKRITAKTLSLFSSFTCLEKLYAMLKIDDP